MRELYFDMTTGISGDMAIAALLSLGVDRDKVSAELSKLLSCKVQLSLEKIYRNAVLANRLIIDCDDASKEYRHFSEIKKMITASSLSETVKTKSLNTFRVIALAEAAVHGVDIEEVHFHEIGAIDTIIDIVGFNLCLEELNIENVTSSHPILGSGTAKTEHGIIPLPAPATVKILEGIEVKNLFAEGEFTTPTGAAILKSTVFKYALGFNGKIIKDAYATGSYEFKNMPNLLRAVLIEKADESIDDSIMITTNIDDSTGEELGYLIDKIMKLSVKDASYTPIFTKKNRPAYKIEVICSSVQKDSVIETLFRYSPTIGVRVQLLDRVVMSRKIIEVKVDGSIVKVKKSSYGDIVKFYPEWDDCVKVAESLSLAPDVIYEKASMLARAL